MTTPKLKSRGKNRNGISDPEELTITSINGFKKDVESKFHGTNYATSNKLDTLNVRLFLRIKNHPLSINFSKLSLNRKLLVLFSIVSSFVIIQWLLSPGKTTDVRWPSSIGPPTSNNHKSYRRILDLKLLGFSSKPRQLRFHYTNGSSIYTEIAKHSKKENKPRKIKMSKAAIKMQKHLRNDEAYEDVKRDPFEEGDCVKQHDWQTSSFPNCNKLHEMELLNSKLINNGYWRDVWRIKDYDKSYHVLKTIRYHHGYTSRNYERHRRDAVAMESLTSSNYVLDIYGYCGQSSIVMYSSQGDLDDLIWNDRHSRDKKDVDSKTLVKVSIQVSKGIGDVHNVVNLDVPAISHADISTGQFIYIDGIFKINDFNRCRFLRWNRKDNHACGYYVGNNPTKFRSPEEYHYEEQSEKVDIYSMGNIFYVLLTKEWPYDDLSNKDAQHEVKRGRPPKIPDSIRNSTDPYIQTLIKATEMCWVYNPVERSSAREIERFLMLSIKSILKESK